MSHILILGGDGYLGWPTAMYFSRRGYDVTVVDNYFRRNACTELDVGMLYPVPTLVERAKIWNELTGKEIKVVIGDLTDPEVMRRLFNGRVAYDWAVGQGFSGIPETVVHYAEQPSAPYSLINYRYANITIQNNLLVTNNLMFAVRDFSRDTHIVKLGTMGEYGTPNIDIEEGWLEIEHKGRRDKVLFPRQAGSLYHTTKIMDTDLLWFGVRMWGLRVTDLMQGPVYGMETEEALSAERMAQSAEGRAHGAEDGRQRTDDGGRRTVDGGRIRRLRRLHGLGEKEKDRGRRTEDGNAGGQEPTANSQQLKTIFNYDEIFGTIVNRFMVQAIVGYPLTVYGKGGQTRGYLNINDTLQCVHMSEKTPAEKGELRIFNQIMETFSANELAEKVQRIGKKMGYDVQIDHLENPRREAEEHYYNPTYQGLVDIGVEPHYLTDDVLEGMMRVVERFEGNIREDVIFRGVKWG